MSPLSLFCPLTADTATCKQVAEHTAGALFPQQGGCEEHFAAALCKRLSKQELLEKGTVFGMRGSSRLYADPQTGGEETADICVVDMQNWSSKCFLYVHVLICSGQPFLNSHYH